MEDEEDSVNLLMLLDDWQDPLLDDQDLGFSSSSSSSSSSDTFLVGFVIAHIVGIQHYPGVIHGREMVGLVREPLNPYDGNAIKVLNMRSMQVGHIERAVASVLSPLLDSNLISIEGIVPNSRTSGYRFKTPCQIHIFARVDAFSSVKSAILQGGLQLISDSDASFTLSEAEAVKEKSVENVKSVDEIFKLVDENVGKKGVLEPLEPPKEVIKSELFAHQKEGLSWLVHRENSGELPPFWEEKNGSFINVLTNYASDNRPEPLRGGIFADDMGLGKTLTLLSLIAYDKNSSGAVSSSFSPSSGCIDVDYKEDTVDFKYDHALSVSISQKSKRSRVGKKGSGSTDKLKIENSQRQRNVKRKLDSMSDESLGQCCTKTTLVVCPPSVFSTWITQLGEHTRPGSLKMYMYYGERSNDAEELKKYDIVMTTYSTLAVEHFNIDSPIKKIEWWRVILDEAHMIKNENANQSRAVTGLKSKRRWVVTGTPIQNGSFDLFSLMVFLRFEPFSIKSYWQRLVQQPIARGNEKGLSRLQVLMATISLRRSKEKGVIGLPPKTVEIFYVELSSEERELYDQLEARAKNVVLDYINASSLMFNYSAILSIILRLRQICTNVALCPADLNSLLPSANMEDVSNNPELLEKMVEVLQDGEDLDCPICMCPPAPTSVVITRCAHIFCRSCILKTLQRTRPCCPLCRRPLLQSDLFSSPPKPADDLGEVASRLTTSSKATALLQLLVASRDQNPTSKSVVFSQFQKMLVLLEKSLKASGFKTVRLDGSMNAKRRTQVIAEFGATGEEAPTVLLASLRASCAGINLTAASTVYLLEPWWNPAVEEQAMDRVHRIGQKEHVKIVRLITKNSIEGRILELQEKKKQLAHDAFRKTGMRNRREIGANDLRTLMSL